MTAPRFLQIHTLHSYTAALLNRDDSGLAKRLPYGEVMRTRISSQCLKRHWRIADKDPHSLHSIDGAEMAYRSRELVTQMVFDPLRATHSSEIIDILEPAFQKAVYGDKGDKGKSSRQTLLLGRPEIDWLKQQAEALAAQVAESTDKKRVAETVAAWSKAFKNNIKAMRDQTALPGGLAAALFGRMVTSDPAANIEAPVYVAHSFTVHAEESEGDYFTAVDDLKREEDDSGADTIQETELTSGLFYGYAVIDLPGLVKNCCNQGELASKIVYNLIHLIAEVSPGAKLGSTAPFGRADLMLVEVGDRQPRSLAAAYRDAIPHNREKAVTALDCHLVKLDEVFATGEERRYLSLADTSLRSREDGCLSKLSLKDLAEWAARQVFECPND